MSRRINSAAVISTHWLAAVLHDTGFLAEYLELQIIESGLMDNQKHTASILNKLNKKGVHLAIDDFGTGYSSLAYLKYFPVDILKIDKILTRYKHVKS